MTIRIATTLFGVNEQANELFGYNAIKDLTGISEEAYELSYLLLNLGSGIGQIAGSKYMTYKSNIILEDILNNPNNINKYSKTQIKIYGKHSTNWKVDKFTQSRDPKKGFKLLNSKDGLIQYSSRSSYHGNIPYWKESSGVNGTIRYDYYLKEILDKLIYLL